MAILPFLLTLVQWMPTVAGKDTRPFSISCDESLSIPSPVLSSRDPFHPLPSSTTSHRVSRARVEILPVLDEELLTPSMRRIDAEDDNERDWVPRLLDVRSAVYAGRRNPDDQISTQSSGLQLHLLRPFPARQSSSSSSSSSLQVHKRYLTKTGTTIAGCVCRGHVILAADTRSTQDTIVADPVAQKLHPLAQNAWCAGAGTAADLEKVTRLCLYSLALEELRSSTIGNGIKPLVSPMYTTPAKEGEENALLVGSASLERICSFLQDQLWEAQGGLGVNLILGCVDRGQAHLRALHGHGSIDVDLPFSALGSGGLAAMSILEQGYQSKMTVAEATELVQSAIVAGIQNDLGSGSQVDLCVISPNGTSQMKRCVVPPQRLEKLEDNIDDEKDQAAESDASGTNGFGNTPFGIASQRVLVESKRAQELKDWSILLGL